MRRFREGVPKLFLGRPWSDRIPWRVHAYLDRQASKRMYRREVLPSIHLRTGVGEANLLFAGDFAFHQWSVSESPERVFGAVREEFDAADFRAVNLETVLTSHDQPGGKIGGFLKAPPEAVQALTYLGVDAVTSANNHALDFGVAGLIECGKTLRQNGIGWFGIDEADGSGGIPGALIQDVKGIKIGMLAATDHFGGLVGTPSPAPVWFDQAYLEAGVRTLRSTCDIVVLHLHWGYERVMYPLRWHRDLARAFVDLGADIVCCHHAHVVMGTEAWGRGVIAHGLGNFYFGSGGKHHPFGRIGSLLRVSVDRGGPISADVLTVRTDSAGQVQLEREACPGYQRLCEGLADDAFLGRVESARVIHEFAQISSGVRSLLAGKDARRLLERQAFLRAPRQRWLLSTAAELGVPAWRPMGSWLTTFRSLPEEAVLRFEVPPPPKAAGLDRRLDSRLLPGRLP